MKKYIYTLLMILTLVPVASFAQATQPNTVKLDYSGLVQCDGVVNTKDPLEKDRNRVCNFVELFSMVKYIINWMFFISVPLATALFAYAGFLYMTGKEKNIGTAKSIFSSVGTGFIIMLVAWFAVVTLVSWFVSPDNLKVINTFINTK
jgi:hypothetical protein